MNRLFGRGKAKEPPPDLGSCISNVDKRAEEMEKKANQCDAELRKIREQMKKMREGPAKNALKQKAMRILQRKKAFDTQTDNMRQQSFNMEQATMAIQTAKDTQVVVGAMKAGVSQMKKEYKKINIDNIEVRVQIMKSYMKLHPSTTEPLPEGGALFAIEKPRRSDLQDELADILEQSEEVQEALGRSYNMPDVDEDELEAELDALGDEIALDDDTSYLDDAVRAPNAPDREPGQPEATRNTDGVAVDEFGLPQVPAT